MITPDERPDFDDEVNDTENPQDSISSQPASTPGEPATANAGGSEADNEGIDRAARAAEGSFTLEAEKGVSPDPDTNNQTDKSDYNIKQ